MNNLNKNRLDKYKAVWLSHSSMQDFEKCPRLYYLHNIYKNNNNRKIGIVSPYMSLGIAVHNVLEGLIKYKSEDRNKQDLIGFFEIEWAKVSGERGGFRNQEEELDFKNRGLTMIQNVLKDPKVLLEKTIPTKSYYSGDMLPNIIMDEYENIILCGNIDWIKYNSDANNLQVVDFKTGRNEEKEDSKQLPIYKILLSKLQSKWTVSNIGLYWYLDSGELKEKQIEEEDLNKIWQQIINIGIDIRDRKIEWTSNGWVNRKNVINNFKCRNSTTEEPDAECFHCKDLARIVRGDLDNIKYVGVDMYGRDSYLVL